MPSQEAPSYSSSRVQRASRLNTLEQARLQQRLLLLEKARVHQVKLTNQDIRLTSIALDYILSCSGHSPEGRGPEGQQGGVDSGQSEDPCFLYGERVVSRKVRRMPRPHSAVERATFRRHTAPDHHSQSSEENDQHSSLPPRPRSSPAKGRSWGWSMGEEGSDPESDRPPGPGKCPSPGGSRPSTAGGRGGAGRGRATPKRAWEEDTDEVTRRLLKAQQRQQQEEELQQQKEQRRSNRYMQDLNRLRSQTPASARGLARHSRGERGINESSSSSPFSPSPFPASPSPRVSSPGGPVMEDPRPVSPRQKRAGSGVGRGAGLSEILNQSRVTLSASKWRSHLASTQLVPRSLDSQQQVIMEAKRQAQKRSTQRVTQRVNTFIGQLTKGT